MRPTKARTALFIAACMLALALGFWVYYPGLTGPFLFDDFPNIVHNHHLDLHSLALSQLSSAALSSQAGIFHRPLSMVSFALNEYFFGKGPYSFKLTNVVINLVAGVLVFSLSWLLLQSYRERYADWLTSARVRWVSLLLAAAWLVHPLNLTAILYIVQRMTSLASLFMLAGICLYLIGRRRQLRHRSGWVFIWIGVPVCGVLGVLCKETAALLSIYLVVVEALIFRFRTASGAISRSVVMFYVLGLVLPGIAGFVLLLAKHSFLHGYTGRDFTLGERLLTEARVVMLYIKWALIPTPARLALYHDDIRASASVLQPMSTLLSIVAIAGWLLLSWLTRRRAPLVALGILWFFGGQLLESTALPLELVYEHRNYLPDYGILLVLFSLLLLSQPSRRRLLWGSGIGLAFLALFASVTYIRADQWRSEQSFAYHEAHHHPASPRATYQLGSVYGTFAMNHPRLDPSRAYAALEQSRRVSQDILPNIGLIFVSANVGRPVRSLWLKDAEHKLRTTIITSEDVTAITTLVKCQQHECDLTHRQVLGLFKAAFANPKLPRLKRSYSNLLTEYATYLKHIGGHMKTVLTALHHSIQASPKTPQYYINLAQTLIGYHKLKAARAQISALKRLNQYGQLDGSIAKLEKSLSATR